MECRAFVLTSKPPRVNLDNVRLYLPRKASGWQCDNNTLSGPRVLWTDPQLHEYFPLECKARKTNLNRCEEPAVLSGGINQTNRQMKPHLTHLKLQANFSALQAFCGLHDPTTFSQPSFATLVSSAADDRFEVRVTDSILNRVVLRGPEITTLIIDRLSLKINNWL